MKTPRKKSTKKTSRKANVSKTSGLSNTSKTQKKRAVSKKARNQGVSRRGGVNTEKNRFRLMWFVTACVFVVLLTRAFWLQVVNPSFYVQKADSTIISNRIERANRGVIYDRHGIPLALSTPMKTLSFNAREYAKAKQDWDGTDSKTGQKEKLLKRLENKPSRKLKDLIDTKQERFNVHALAQAAGVDVRKIQAKLDAPKGELPKSQYLILKRRLPPATADVILAKKFVGVHAETEYKRYYPQPQPNAHILGYMGRKDNDYVGKAGLENIFNATLGGEDGKVSVVRGARGVGAIDNSLIKPDIQGEDVELSIDSRLQYILYRELEKSGRKYAARSASGMVVNAKTGEVLAISNWPSFNTNNMAERTDQNERNRALVDAFEPGSVVKPFTVAAGLESGKFNKHSLINTYPSSVTISGKTFYDHGVLSPVSLEKLLRKSSNVASIKIGLALPHDGVTNMFQKVGLGEKTGLQFPSEQSGNVTAPTKRQSLRRASVTFGYSMEVTLGQLAQAYSILAADGVKRPLTFTKVDDAPTGEQVIAKQTARDILEMMESVTKKGGTGTQAAIAGYRVSGKTGTAKKLRSDGKGYYESKYRALFCGIAPSSDPQFVTVILVEDPVGEFSGGKVAAPVFAAVTKEALRLNNVPLDRPLTDN